MKLTNINQLHNEMKENKQPRQQFQIEYNHVLADVFFFKTRTLMGEAAYQRCLKEKISTKWTDEKGADRYRQWKEIAPSDYLDS
ncbi:hypothetical protein A7X67_11000 [Clostridium sp. W14A]|nr:hypothetical protein A7X67_11000 [Clostridium sp. W14A]